MAASIVRTTARRGWLIGVLYLAGCGAPLVEPELARGLSPNFAVGERELNARVRARYLIGSSQERLIAELRHQGFRIDPEDHDERGIWHSATFERHDLVCIIIWSVRWRSQGQRIMEIWAVYGGQCL